MIEAIAERLDWKRDLYEKIGAHIAPHAIVASNTSGLSLAALDDAMPAALRARFCGVHFFNPPRYMHLVELIAAPATDPALLDALEAFLTTTLGKGVVRAQDTPNFIANRIGVFSMLATMVHAERLGLGFDVVDALTGPAIGRAEERHLSHRRRRGPRHDRARDRDDARHAARRPVARAFRRAARARGTRRQGRAGTEERRRLLSQGGARTSRCSIPRAATYRASSPQAAPEVLAILAQKDPHAVLAQLRAGAHPQAQLLWSIFRDVFHYAAFHLAAIADNARDVDLAIRWGFGWTRGPFETWQAAGSPTSRMDSRGYRRR